MLYEMLIPWTDIDGRFHADPYIFRGNVCPRLKHISPEIVEECLKDMAENTMILLYEIDGDLYGYLRLHEQKQSLRRDKEGKSKIPPPPEDLLQKFLSETNVPALDLTPGVTPGVTPGPDPGPGPDEVKQSKGKGKLNKAKALTPSFEFRLPKKDVVDNAALNMIYALINDVGKQLVDSGIFPEAMDYITQKRNFHVNERALLHTLCKAAYHKPDKPKAYMENIIKVEDANYNEKDHGKL
jgi:hypothetical protein